MASLRSCRCRSQDGGQRTIVVGQGRCVHLGPCTSCTLAGILRASRVPVKPRPGLWTSVTGSTRQFRCQPFAQDVLPGAMAVEPGVVDVDNVREAVQQKPTVVTDREKAALNGITTEQTAEMVQGGAVGPVRSATARNPLRIEVCIPVDASDQRGRLDADPGQRGPRPTGAHAAGREMPLQTSCRVSPAQTCILIF